MKTATTATFLIMAISLALALATNPTTAAETRSLAERLGYAATDKLLIVNADDTGMCHASNLAVMDALENGSVSSATIMVPCPWFPEIAAYAKAHPQKDFGIHLCHTAEWSKYRWGPVAPRDQVPGLLDPQGYLWPDVPEVYAHATPEQALVEGRAQIRRALDAGVDVTHLDSHMGTLQLNPDYVRIYLQLATEFNLPVRMASQNTLARLGHPELRAQFSAKGVVFPDYFIYEELKDEAKDVKAFWLNVLKNLKTGVTELYIHPAVANDELKAITASWPVRSKEYETFTKDEEIKRIIGDQKITLIGYRPLRDLQRKSANK